jgi:hypothetical protein
VGWYVLGRRAPQPAAAGGISGTAGATAGAATSTVPPASVAAAPGETAPAAVPEGAAGPPTGTTSSNSAGSAAAASGPGVRPAGGAPPSRSAGGTAAAGTGEAAPPPGTVAEPPARAADSRFRYLDEEGAGGDGREAGDRAADAYKGRQGWQRGSGDFGTNRRFAQRPRSPRDLGLGERPAVATLRHVMDREEVYKKATGRYGTLAEMARASGFGLDVPYAATSFQRKGYRFDLTIEEDGFRITAVPAGPGPRSFVGDDSGYIRSGLE